MKELQRYCLTTGTNLVGATFVAFGFRSVLDLANGLSLAYFVPTRFRFAPIILVVPQGLEPGLYGFGDRPHSR